MLFNSSIFLVFFPVVFALHWLIAGRSIRMRNALLLLASYIFYGWWDVRFLALLAFSSVVDYTIARAIAATPAMGRRRLYLAVSMVINLGLLCYFKYVNFFIEGCAQLLAAIGFEAHISSLAVILPVGISFYTFQTMSYTIDVYRRQLEPARDPIDFFTFVSFFPQLVAGPIERATNLLPQFSQPSIFIRRDAVDGLRQILWGFFKKVVVADTCASHVDVIFGQQGELPGSILFLGMVYFAFQIYGDFSGYSDIAVGTARLLGFRLMTNFRLPYFSRDVAEFWRRWHISLSTWFRDYLYIPLGGSRGGVTRNVLNVLVIFTVSGFWHGANWTFIVWGALNGLFFIPLLLRGSNRANMDTVAPGRYLPTLRELVAMLMTFLLICITWVFFRSASMTDAMAFLRGMASPSLFTAPTHPMLTWAPLGAIALLVLVEWVQRHREHTFDVACWPIWLRWPAYYAVLMLILQYGQPTVSFIYFQF
jgi:D-alanyl-lipoteichoic acid acyltransferase DltB (MBOAT superfamily)